MAKLLEKIATKTREQWKMTTTAQRERSIKRQEAFASIFIKEASCSG
jgi:hypothetical protein